MELLSSPISGEDFPQGPQRKRQEGTPREQDALQVGLSRSPYVEMGMKGTALRALVTG